MQKKQRYNSMQKEITTKKQRYNSMQKEITPPKNPLQFNADKSY